MSNSDPSLCENLIDIVSGLPLTDPMKRTYGGYVCGKLKLPTEMYCTECAELIESHKRLEKGE